HRDRKFARLIDEPAQIERHLDSVSSQMDEPEPGCAERRSSSKRFIAIRTSMAKGTVATRYMNSAIPSSNIRAPNGPASRESTFTELHARNSIMPIQKGTTGHTNRMFTVTMVPRRSRRKFPSIIGTNAFWYLMTRCILKRLPATLPSKYPRLLEVGHPHFLGGSTIS